MCVIVTDSARFAAIIPARGGSKGILRKNLREVAGQPLLAWTIAAVAAATRPMRAVVSTDDEEIAAVARTLGAEVPCLRPAELSGDEAPSEDALLHALDTLEGGADIEAVVMLQPTSPLRLPGTLDAAIDLYEASGSDSLVSVVETSPFLWTGSVTEPVPGYDIDRRPRRQDLDEAQRRYRENGSIYVSAVDVLRSRRNRLGGRITMFVMDPREGVDVDEEVDLRIVAELLEELR